MIDLVSQFSRILSSHYLTVPQPAATATFIPWIQCSYIAGSLQFLPTKHLDSLLTRTYTALAKSSSLTVPTPTELAPIPKQQHIDQPHPSHILLIRTYALHCLLQTTPSIISPSTFWDQVVKFGVQFVRATSTLQPSRSSASGIPTRTVLASGTKSNIVNGKKVAGSGMKVASTGGKGNSAKGLPELNQEKDRESAETEATEQVMKIFDEIYEKTKGREDQEKWLGGRGFVSFCEYWMGFCKKVCFGHPSFLHVKD